MNYQISFAAILKIICSTSVYLLIYNGIETKKDGKKVLYSIVLSSVIPMCYGYYQFVTGKGHAWKHEFGYKLGGQRIDSFLGEYNSYGIFLSITICAALMLILLERTLQKHKNTLKSV